MSKGPLTCPFTSTYAGRLCGCGGLQVRDWYSKLYQRQANYELPEEDVRQLMYELEASYNSFMANLKGKK